MSQFNKQAHLIQTSALKILKEISYQDQNIQKLSWDHQKMQKMQKRCKKMPYHKATKSNYQTNTNTIEQSTYKPEKLPLIPSKNNISENNHNFITNKRINSYILFQKGLGMSGTLGTKKSKKNNFLNNNKFVRLYTQSNQQQFQLVKEWLNFKRQSCRSLLNSKKKYKTLPIQNKFEIHVKHLI